MPSITPSDLSQMFQLRRDTVRVRQDLATATQELSSGKHADLGRALSGNYGPLVAIDQQLSTLDAFDTNAKEAKLFTDAAQRSLERVRTTGSDLGRRLIGILESDVSSSKEMLVAEANAAFGVSVSALNGTVAGRALFGGTATDRPALAPADDMLAKLRELVEFKTTAAEVIDEVNQWFDVGGGFDTAHYFGSTTDLSPYRVADGHKIEMTLRADDTVVRNQLKGLALAALLEGSSITDSGELAELADKAATLLLGNEAHLVTAQAGIGAAQARIEDAMARNGSERTSLRIARSEIAAVDPYKVATDLQNLQTQLETIYTITARLSGLSLTNYLR